MPPIGIWSCEQAEEELTCSRQPRSLEPTAVHRVGDDPVGCMTCDEQGESPRRPPEPLSIGRDEKQDNEEHHHAPELSYESSNGEAGIVDRLYRPIGWLIEPQFARELEGVRQ